MVRDASLTGPAVPGAGLARNMRLVTTKPPDSPWRITLQAARKRKLVTVTLSDEARRKLKRAAKRAGLTMSRMVEQMIIEWRIGDE